MASTALEESIDTRAKATALTSESLVPLRSFSSGYLAPEPPGSVRSSTVIRLLSTFTSPILQSR